MVRTNINDRVADNSGEIVWFFCGYLARDTRDTRDTRDARDTGDAVATVDASSGGPGPASRTAAHVVHGLLRPAVPGGGQRYAVLLGAVLCLAGILAVTLLARLVQEYLTPLIPFVGAALLVITGWTVRPHRRCRGRRCR